MSEQERRKKRRTNRQQLPRGEETEEEEETTTQPTAGVDIQETDEQKVRCFRTPDTSSVILVVSIPYNRTYDNVHFLVDLFKSGIKDCYSIRGPIKKSLDRLQGNIQSMDGDRIQIEEISKKEAVYLLVRGYNMRKELDFPISKQTEKWLKKLNIPSYDIKGSPFKCYECERGNLSSDEIETIKKATKEDYRAGTLGKQGETMIYFTCDDCKSEPH